MTGGMAVSQWKGPTGFLRRALLLRLIACWSSGDQTQSMNACILLLPLATSFLQIGRRYAVLLLPALSSVYSPPQPAVWDALIEPVASSTPVSSFSFWKRLSFLVRVPAG